MLLISAQFHIIYVVDNSVCKLERPSSIVEAQNIYYENCGNLFQKEFWKFIDYARGMNINLKYVCK
jgi:hypothetical protein